MEKEIVETIKVGSFKEFIADMLKRNSDHAELGMTLPNGRYLKVVVTIEELSEN